MPLEGDKRFCEASLSGVPFDPDLAVGRVDAARVRRFWRGSTGAAT